MGLSKKDVLRKEIRKRLIKLNDMTASELNEIDEMIQQLMKIEDKDG